MPIPWFATQVRNCEYGNLVIVLANFVNDQVRKPMYATLSNVPLRLICKFGDGQSAWIELYGIERILHSFEQL